MLKIALIPGHDAHSLGAINYKNESEYPWAKRNLSYVQKILADSRLCEARIFDRTGIKIEGATKLAGEWGADISLELHFNSAPSTAARGCEALIVKDDKNAFEFGDYVTDVLNARMHIFERHKDGVKEMVPGERGYNNVLQAQKNGIKYYCLLEPCFGHDYSESETVFENEPYFASVLAEGLLGFIEQIGSLPSPKNEKATLAGLVQAVKNTTSFQIPSLKPICLAQYLLESGRVTSKLATDFFNFGGVKWRDELNGIKGCKPFQYSASDGLDIYVACDDFEAFFNYYWGFLSRNRYNGWQNAASQSPEEFIRFISEAGYCPAENYAAKVIKLLPDATNLLA